MTRLTTSVRAAWWTLRAIRSVQRQLRYRRIDELSPVAPPAAGGRGVRAVGAVLRIRQPSCLVSAAVRQAWLAGQGQQRDLVVGVRGGCEFVAHAWLEGDPPSTHEGFHEIFRRAAAS